MTPDRGAPGPDTFSLRPTGWGRYVDVVFLGVWIAGWFVGELVGLAFVGGLLVAVVAAAIGIMLPFAVRLVPDGSTPFFLLGSLVWLTLWTVGGVAALTHFLRSMAGQDVITVSSRGVELRWRAGPFYFTWCRGRQPLLVYRDERDRMATQRQLTDVRSGTPGYLSAIGPD